MQAQFPTRGIYRANAQRLSISLGPLVAQRSLLFRVKADLATKTHYGQLTPTTDESDFESPALFAITASATLLSAVLTIASAVSAASMYSQDSWQGTHSPFFKPGVNSSGLEGLKAPQSPLVQLQHLAAPEFDTRRHAVAFSPSIQWDNQAEDDGGGVRESQLVEIPLTGRSEAIPPQEPAPTPFVPGAMEVALPPSIFISGPQKDTGKLKKKRASEDLASRHSKVPAVFSKVMSRLSMQPSKKEITAAERRQTAMTISHPMPRFDLLDLKALERAAADYKLPALKTPGPIRMSFIVAPAPQAPPALPAPPAVAENTEAPAGPRPRPPRPMRPMTPGRARAQTLPAPLTPAREAPTQGPHPPKMGHRRYKSSPAVMNFDLHKRDEASPPPLPPMPAHVVVPLKLAPAPPPRSSLRVRRQTIAAKLPANNSNRATMPANFAGGQARYGAF